MYAWNFREPVSAWSHFAGLLLALPGTVILWTRSGGNPGKRISLLVYGLGLVSCYAASTLYHGVRLPADRLVVFRRLDSVGIFALIAGTYTPIACNLMRGRWRIWTLATVWGTAAALIAVIASGRHVSAVTGTYAYLAMGWGGVVCYVRIARVVCHIEPFSRLSSAACSTAWRRCSTCSSVPRSGRASSAPTTCSTCS